MCAGVALVHVTSRPSATSALTDEDVMRLGECTVFAVGEAAVGLIGSRLLPCMDGVSCSLVVSAQVNLWSNAVRSLVCSLRLVAQLTSDGDCKHRPRMRDHDRGRVRARCDLILRLEPGRDLDTAAQDVGVASWLGRTRYK